MTGLIIGDGEIGFSLREVLNCEVLGKHEDGRRTVDIIHICFPYSAEFEFEVKKYQKLHKPKFTVIHSTVPVGTNRILNSISSPVIGIHPHLEKSLKTFVKYLGGEQASEVADYFRRCGLKVYLFDRQETTELMKILDTTFYGVCLEYTKDVKRQCEEFHVPFEAWTLYCNNYNKGYQKLGYPEFTRPNLVPIQKKLGGHCVLQNADLLDTPFTKFIKELNETNHKTN